MSLLMAPSHDKRAALAGARGCAAVRACHRVSMSAENKALGTAPTQFGRYATAPGAGFMKVSKRSGGGGGRVPGPLSQISRCAIF